MKYYKIYLFKKLAIISSGEYFGASGLLEGKNRDYSARVSSTEAKLISLTKEVFRFKIQLFKLIRNF